MEFKVKYKECTYEEFLALTPMKYIKPKAPNFFLRTLAAILSTTNLRKTHFKYESIGMERLGKDEPALFLMNHSCFLDFEIVMKSLWPRKVNIVTGMRGCLGKERLMRNLGCILTRKFTTNLSLVKDIKYCLETLKTSVLMYPEADYSFTGRSHIVPKSVAQLIKWLGVPFVMIETKGAFNNDPIYCNLGNRYSPVRAEFRYVLSPEDIEKMSVEEIEEVVKREFSFDNLRWQQENKIVIDHPRRAENLQKILYKCPHCHSEGQTEGIGTKLVCYSCGKEWELTELGYMKATSGDTEFDHIPDWYEWQRECVRAEIEEGKFKISAPVDVYAAVNTEAIYILGKGQIEYDMDGIRLTAYDGKLDFYKKSKSMHAIGADLHCQDVGDVTCFGDHRATYLVLPYEAPYLVVKARLASEEIYKILKKSDK